MSYFPNPSELFQFSTKIPDGTLPLVEKINWALIVAQRCGRPHFTVDLLNRYTGSDTDPVGVAWVRSTLLKSGWKSTLDTSSAVHTLTVYGYEEGSAMQLRFDNSPDEWLGLGPGSEAANAELKLALRKAAEQNSFLKEMIVHPQNEVIYPATPPISPEEALEAAIRRMKNQQKENNNG